MKIRLRNDFWEISEKNSSKKWFPTQWNSSAKNSRTTVFQESLALNFRWNALTTGILWQYTHSQLVDLFSYFSQLQHSCLLHRSWWIPASSWSLPTLKFGRVWHTQVQTGSRGFYFTCCSIPALLSAKSFWVLILFSCGT